MQDNPVGMLKPIKLNTENTQKRRALTEDEISKRLSSTEESEHIYRGLNDRLRSLVYQLALTCCLRHNEIKTLLRDDLDLEAGTVTARDVNAKNSKTDVLPLQESLRKQPEDYFNDFPALPNAKAFEKMGAKGFMMVRKDLEAAEIEYETEEGKADFHALRHTFCSLLAKNGVLPQTAQRLMRHSDINLTMKAYTHILIGDKKLAIAALPEIRKKASNTYNIGLKVGSGGENSGGEKLAISADFGDICANSPEKSISELKSLASASDPYISSAKPICDSLNLNKDNIDLSDTNGGGGGNRTRTPDIVTTNSDNSLQDIINPQVAKNGLFHPDQNKTHNICSSNTLQDQNSRINASLISAINAVNSLPLQDAEKADIIRKLMNT